MGKPPLPMNLDINKPPFLRKNGERGKEFFHSISIFMDYQPTIRASLGLDVNDAPHVGFVDPFPSDTDAAEGGHLFAPFHPRYQALRL